MLPLYLLLSAGIGEPYYEGNSRYSQAMDRGAFLFVPKPFLLSGLYIDWDWPKFTSLAVLLALGRMARDACTLLLAVAMGYYISARSRTRAFALPVSIVAVPVLLASLFAWPEWLLTALLALMAGIHGWSWYMPPQAVRTAVTIYFPLAAGAALLELFFACFLVHRVGQELAGTDDEETISLAGGFVLFREVARLPAEAAKHWRTTLVGICLVLAASAAFLAPLYLPTRTEIISRAMQERDLPTLLGYARRGERGSHQAFNALIWLRPPEAMPGLVDMLEDADPRVRGLAAFTLGRIGAAAGEAAPALAKVLRDPDPIVRGFAAEALGRIGPPARGAVRALERARADEDANVRGAVAWALKKIRGGEQEDE